MVVCMQVDRISITMPPEIGRKVRDAAEEEGVSVSAWITEAAAERVRNRLLGKFLDEYQAEHGAFTDEEMERAAQRLGLDRSKREIP
jgi:hypothetical protein